MFDELSMGLSMGSALSCMIGQSLVHMCAAYCSCVGRRQHLIGCGGVHAAAVSATRTPEPIVVPVALRRFPFEPGTHVFEGGGMCCRQSG